MIGEIELIITIIFALYVFSYYVLFFLKKPKIPKEKSYSSISILVPARNEERYIKQCVESLLQAKWDGKKEIIVLNDASIDSTANILKSFGSKITVITNKKHSGKSASINIGIKKATGELLAIVDGDSEIAPDALIYLKKEVEKKNVAAASSVIRVKNRKMVYTMWLHLEVIYTSLTRILLSKVGANVVTPGALSVYRRKELLAVGGFSTQGFAEDADVAIRLHRQGYKAHIVEKAISDTNMYDDLKGFIRQRFRIARGVIKLLKTHMKLNNTIIDLYTLPFMFFSYVQAVVMGSLTIYKIIEGYFEYFASQGVYMSTSVLTFFLDWFSILGFVKWAIRVLSGTDPFTLLAAIGIFATLLTYPLFAYSIFAYDKKLDVWHVVSFFFMPIYWLINMVFYIISLPELFKKEQYNIWKKNE